jgi:hypothetical protein
MAVVDDFDAIADRYLTFADLEARGSSPSYEAWSRAVAGDRDLLARLATLPARKQQPNLVFAALRWHGERAGDAGSLRHGLVDAWDEVSRTIMGRATQTNEPARCAVLLPLLHRIELGDLRDDLRGRLEALVAEAPAEATPVVFHSAALAYLSDGDRMAAAAAITGSRRPLDQLRGPRRAHAGRRPARAGHTGHRVRRRARPGAVRSRQRARRHDDGASIVRALASRE